MYNFFSTFANIFLKKFFCNLGSYWEHGDFAARQKLQKLLFRAAIGYDKSIGDYRTMEVNVVADVIRAITRDCRERQTKSDCDFTLQSLDVETTQRLSNNLIQDYESIVDFLFPSHIGRS